MFESSTFNHGSCTIKVKFHNSFVYHVVNGKGLTPVLDQSLIINRSVLFLVNFLSHPNIKLFKKSLTYSLFLSMNYWILVLKYLASSIELYALSMGTYLSKKLVKLSKKIFLSDSTPRFIYI
jgi:hypothetical protein